MFSLGFVSKCYKTKYLDGFNTDQKEDGVNESVNLAPVLDTGQKQKKWRGIGGMTYTVRITFDIIL